MLLKSTVPMAMYSIRSERAFGKRLTYDLLSKWFLEMRIDQPAFDRPRSPNAAHARWSTRSDEFFASAIRPAVIKGSRRPPGIAAS
jgi:hypothetical protein